MNSKTIKIEYILIYFLKTTNVITKRLLKRNVNASKYKNQKKIKYSFFKILSLTNYNFSISKNRYKKKALYLYISCRIVFSILEYYNKIHYEIQDAKKYY